MKQERGIALVALVIFTVVVGVVIFAGLQYARNYISAEKNVDIKSTMLTIQGMITNVRNKHIVDEENNALLGTKLDLENNETEFVISEGLKNELQGLEGAELYILSRDDLENMGIKNVDVSSNKFFIVDYNSEEVFYSLGVEGKYKLSEI